MVDHSSTETPHLKDLLAPVLRRAWVILAATIVAAAATWVYYDRQPREFTAGTLVFYKEAGDPLGGYVPPSSDRTIENQASLLYSAEFAAQVARRIRFQGPSSALLDAVTVSAQPGSDLLAISTRATTARAAAQIANGYAEQFVEQTERARTSRLQSAIVFAKRQLAAIPRGQESANARESTETQIRTLEFALSQPTADATRQVNPAVAPAEPAAPRPRRNALFAGAFGFLLAVAFAFGLERFDRRLRSPDDIAAAYDSVLLASLPHSAEPKPSQAGKVALAEGFHESLRVLRANIELERLDAPPRTFLVTSAVPGEGKSTVARNLALALRESGRTVVVVETDLRRPTQHLQFAVESRQGLTDVLTGQLSLDDALITVPVDLPGLEALEKLGRQQDGAPADPTVSLLLAGSPSANPPAVLASDRTAQILNELRSRFDVVVIDSPPALSVSDTIPMLRYADATLVVARVGRSTRDSASRFVSVIERVADVDVVGVVANDLSSTALSGYGYDYGDTGSPAVAT